MAFDITLGQYLPGDSFIHRLDPRTKLIIAVALIVVLFLVDTFVGYFWIALFLFLAIVNGNIPIKSVVKSLKPLTFIIVLTVILNILFTDGNTLFQLGFIRITDQGLYKGLMLGFRLILLILSTTIMTLTTSPLAITDALENLLGPLKKLKFPVHELSMMLTIALRFIPTLLEETDKIMKAQMARGADFESGNLLKRAQNMVPLLVPLFVSAFRRADDLAIAMESRCYRGGEGRTRLKELVYEKVDYVTLLVVILALALVVYLF
ncbi:MAG: energy-coupling factor transporter transmembrane component T [Firmicutes bacterium]|nr:energy-coupling factor transporter transmembrane component T [Bacillota bacterium]MDD4264177.1 energy-coupling factor transporter transmembrane component T [Bacillota bacterium]MDD4693368.1 energy-coupling factor transporter transmembrane component T [Bacillota bacterium]